MDEWIDGWVDKWDRLPGLGVKACCKVTFGSVVAIFPLQRQLSVFQLSFGSTGGC